MGMPEYHDGSFGAIKPVDESVKDLLDRSTNELERTRALHIGKFEELIAKKEAAAEGLPKDTDPLVSILQHEFGKLRLDVNRILASLGL